MWITIEKIGVSTAFSIVMGVHGEVPYSAFGCEIGSKGMEKLGNYLKIATVFEGIQ